MNAPHYDAELIKFLFLDGLSACEIATVFTGSRGAVYYHIKKSNIYLKKKCVECGTYFETRVHHQRFCKMCASYGRLRYYEIRNVRSSFAKVVNRNPELAEFLQKWMQEEEGDDFTDMAIDGILEKEKYTPKKDGFKFLGDEFLEKKESP